MYLLQDEILYLLNRKKQKKKQRMFQSEFE